MTTYTPSRADFAALLKRVGPRCIDPDGWAAALLPAMQRFKITDADVVAMFLAQLMTESGELNRVAENLDYRAERLMAVWPRRFPTPAVAKQYEHNPEALANFVYAGRLGNGDAASGDGYKYRGRGPIQTTGRAQYAALQIVLALPLLTKPDLLVEKPVGALAAAYYWDNHTLSRLAAKTDGDDQEKDFALVTRGVNGGLTGVESRHAYWMALKAELGIAT